MSQQQEGAPSLPASLAYRMLHLPRLLHILDYS